MEYIFEKRWLTHEIRFVVGAYLAHWQIKTELQYKERYLD